jgi:organic hydroperoxide reductase OsmC/OhrA
MGARSSHDHEHHFECRLTWIGASRGPTRSYDAYDRSYRIEFEGKPPLVGSAAAVFRGDPAVHNPEEWLVAALSACHCLSYLALAARAQLLVVAYEDQATGTMARIDGKIRFREVTLRPRVRLLPGSDVEQARALHEKAHAECFIASSVNFPVVNEPEIVEEA